MPMKRELYPENWEEISAAIRTRAGNKCERCGLPNGANGARDRQGQWHQASEFLDLHEWPFRSLFAEYPPRLIKVVLTVAHLNQDPSDNRPENLACLCQRCHLNHDRPWNVVKCRETWRRKRIIEFESSGQLPLFGDEICHTV